MAKNHILQMNKTSNKKRNIFYVINLFLTVVIVGEIIGILLINLDIFSPVKTQFLLEIHHNVSYYMNNIPSVIQFEMNNKNFNYPNNVEGNKATNTKRGKSLQISEYQPIRSVQNASRLLIPQKMFNNTRHNYPQINQSPINSDSSSLINFYQLGQNITFGSEIQLLPLLRIDQPSTNNIAIGGGNIRNVFLIILENANWSNIIGNYTNAPYINQQLLTHASYANNYYNPIGIHPSEPNYIWLEAGSNTNLDGRRFTTDDDPSFINSTDDTMHLISLLTANNYTWKAYLEGISGNTCPTNSNHLYAAKHNPTIFFQDITNNNTYCTSHERPYTDLSKDLHTNAVANYNIIIPNVCNDGHDDCSPSHNKILQSDHWLSKNIPVILKSQIYQSSGLILITWDEGEDISDSVTNNGPIGLIALSPFVKGNGYSNEIYYTHSSTLRTIEEIFNIPYLRDSANAADLNDLFTNNYSKLEYTYLPFTNFIFQNKIFAAISN